MHVGITFLRWRENRFRHSRRIRNPQFAYLVRGPLEAVLQCNIYFADSTTLCIQKNSWPFTLYNSREYRVRNNVIPVGELSIMFRIFLMALSMYPLAHHVHASRTSKPICQQRHTQPPRVSHRCVTDTEMYANKTVKQRHCMLLCMRDPSCQVINFNVMRNYCLLGHRSCLFLERDENYVTIPMKITMPCLKWIPTAGNDIYKVISSQPSAITNVIRVTKEENEIPGKWGVGWDIVHYAYKGEEKIDWKEAAEFLTLSPVCTISWVPYDSASGQQLPVGAVIGGHLNNGTLYIARTGSGQSPSHSTGYYDKSNGFGHFPNGDVDHVFNEFEILVVQGWTGTVAFKTLYNQAQYNYSTCYLKP